ncbi:MAG TPA: hypothetical protein VIL20_16570 [Sandaracinaceae bacterium]
MRNVILLSLLLGGCYAVHEPLTELQRAGAREAVPVADAGSDPAAECMEETVADRDFVVTDAEAADAEPVCSALCRECPNIGPYDGCVAACALRYAVASGNGCASDFPAWTECIAANECDPHACWHARTCW